MQFLLMNVAERWDWLLLIGWVVMGVVGSLVYSAVLYASYHDPAGADGRYLFVALIVPALVVGVGQWFLLHWRLHLPMAFMVPWLIGSVIAGCAALGLLNFQDYEYIPVDNFMSGGFVGGILGTIAGIAQAAAFWGRVRWAAAWVGVSAAGSALSWPTAQYVGNLLVRTNYDANLAYLMSAAVTGLLLVWLASLSGRESRSGTSR